MKKAKLLMPILGVTTLSTCLVPLTSCGGSGGGSQEEIKVEEVKFNQEYSYVEIGATRDFSKEVKVLPESATNKNLTWKISQDTSNDDIAKVDENTGIVTGISRGYVKLTCTSKDGSQKSSEQWIVVGQYVALEDFKLGSSEESIHIGESTRLSRTFTPENATTAVHEDEGLVEWESSDSSVASVDENGLIRGKGVGTAIISATPYDYNASTKTIELKEELKRECKVTVDYADAEEIIVTPDKATIGVGDSIIVKGSVLPVGAKQDAVCVGAYPETVVTYDDNTKKVTGVAEGEGYVVFKSESEYLYGAASINVIEKVVPVQSIEFAETTEVTKKIGEKWETSSSDITITPSTATQKGYSLESDNPDVAYVDPKNSHNIIAKSEGSANISVVSEDGEHRSTISRKITVERIAVTGVELNTTAAVVTPNKTIRLTAKVLPENATIKDVTWESDHPEIATVNDGVVTGVTASDTPALITVTTVDGSKTATCSVTVQDEFIEVTKVTLSQSSIEMKMSGSTDITATVEPTTATYKHVKWYTNDDTVAKVTPKTGVATETATITPVGPGTTQVYAMSLDGSWIYSNECQVTVTYDDVQSVTLDSSTKEMIVGKQAKLIATVAPATACQDVKWTSSAPSKISVDQNGTLNALTEGTATITCTSVANPAKLATCTVTAKPEIIPVTEVKLNPTKLSIEVGKTTNLPEYTLVPETCTHKGIIWSTSAEGYISIDNNQIKALKEGEVDLTCESVDGPKATCHITITKAAPTSIKIIRAPQMLSINETDQIVCKVLPEEASQNVIFESLNPDILSVDEKGNVKGLKQGIGQIKITSAEKKEVSKIWGIQVAPIASIVNDTWDNVCYWANKGLDELHRHYSLDCEQNPAPFKGTLLGYERSITLNGVEHKVRIVGENHDALSDSGNKTTLTFELVTLLSASDKKGMPTYWNRGEWATNDDYRTSDLYYDLNGDASGKPAYLDKTCMETIINENLVLSKNIKQVKKYVASTKNGFSVKEYNTYLFPLTITELNASSSLAEGSVYEFYARLSGKELNNKRLKRGANGGVGQYWTPSPDTSGNNRSWIIYKDGTVEKSSVGNMHNISFAFCI